MQRLMCFLALYLTLALPVLSTAQTQNPFPLPDDRFSSPLSREIRRQLLLLPYYSVFDYLTFSVQGNRVTLTGQVLRPTLKSQAESTIQSLDGVGAVTNHIEVLPVSPGDDELRRAVYRALFEEPSLALYAISAVPAIHILIKNGNLTIEGIVDSSSDKKLAAVRAGAVAGVRSFQNNLVVSPHPSAAE